MAQAYVAVGSNIDPETNIRSALRQLRAAYGRLAISTVYQSPAQGFVADDFYNLVIGFETTESPHALRDRLARIEQAHGRVRYDRGLHARTLDLDLLAYDDLVLRTEELTLPRPEIARYAFVLRPLAEIASEQKHPETGITYGEMWTRFDAARQPLRPVMLEPAL